MYACKVIHVRLHAITMIQINRVKSSKINTNPGILFLGFVSMQSIAVWQKLWQIVEVEVPAMYIPSMNPALED